MTNPYLSPTTMPDGTTRRPIVERVPECRTDRIGEDDGSKWVFEKDNSVYLALCRHAVETWARATFDEDDDSNDGLIEMVLLAIDHAACNEAAHRLADALGIAP